MSHNGPTAPREKPLLICVNQSRCMQILKIWDIRGITWSQDLRSPAEFNFNTRTYSEGREQKKQTRGSEQIWSSYLLPKLFPHTYRSRIPEQLLRALDQLVCPDASLFLPPKLSTLCILIHTYANQNGKQATADLHKIINPNVCRQKFSFYLAFWLSSEKLKAKNLVWRGTEVKPRAARLHYVKYIVEQDLSLAEALFVQWGYVTHTVTCTGLLSHSLQLRI